MPDVLEEGGLAQQRAQRAPGGNLTVFQHDDLGGVAVGFEAVGDGEAGVPRRMAKRRSQNSCSVRTSSALEASSNTSSSGRRANMRAAAERCTWPPESVTPRVPTRVSSPWPSCLRSSSSTARCTAEPWTSNGQRLGKTHQDVVLQRLGEEARGLGGVGRARRGHEGGRIVDRRAVPAHLAALDRQQADDRLQQRRLAGSQPGR